MVPPVGALVKNRISNSMRTLVILFIATLITAASCKEEVDRTDEVVEKPVVISFPDFNKDSAYHFIVKQVEFGPRVPGTPQHDSAAQWIKNKMIEFAGEENVQIQEAEVQLFNREKIRIKNIITTINPEIKTGRILLCAHWDSRMFADYDHTDRDKPILGANDGASGVAVLMEIARQIQNQPLQNTGIDIIFFDAEDQGTPDNMGYSKGPESVSTWCLGSQYWSRNQHNAYSYAYGILLDMVGAKNAVFPKEGYSRNFAPNVVRKVWDIAQGLGYSNYFVNLNGSEITDDHYFLNTLAKIPTIDIIHYNPENGRFWQHWHTHQDNLENIDPNTLNAVGRTVLKVIYGEDTAKKNL